MSSARQALPIILILIILIIILPEQLLGQSSYEADDADYYADSNSNILESTIPCKYGSRRGNMYYCSKICGSVDMKACCRQENCYCCPTSASCDPMCSYLDSGYESIFSGVKQIDSKFSKDECFAPTFEYFVNTCPD